MLRKHPALARSSGHRALTARFVLAQIETVAPPDCADKTMPPAYAGSVPHRSPPNGRRAATAQEIEALASAPRLRILRLTLEDAMTNGQLAARLSVSPATSLYHVRKLVAAGLLHAEPARPRPAGGYEIPYRSTRRSWSLEIAGADRPNAEIFDAFVAEVGEAGSRAVDHASRLRARLTPERKAELTSRIRGLWEEFADDEDGEPWSLFFAMHPDPTGPGAG